MNDFQRFALFVAVITAVLAGLPLALDVLEWPAVTRYIVNTYQDASVLGQAVVFSCVIAGVAIGAYMFALLAAQSLVMSLGAIGIRMGAGPIAIVVIVLAIAGTAFFANIAGG